MEVCSGGTGGEVGRVCGVISVEDAGRDVRGEGEVWSVKGGDVRGARGEEYSILSTHIPPFGSLDVIGGGKGGIGGFEGSRSVGELVEGLGITGVVENGGHEVEREGAEVSDNVSPAEKDKWSCNHYITLAFTKVSPLT